MCSASHLTAIAFFVLARPLVAVEPERRAEVIPVAEIWAHRIPKTRDVNKLDNGQAQGFLVDPILVTLKRIEKAEPGAAVRGEGLEALREVYRLRVRKEAEGRLTNDHSISVFFFTSSLGMSIRLVSAERDGATITVSYQFLPNEQLASSRHFALIPLGKLQPGKYRVRFDRTPMAEKYRKLGFKDPTPEAMANLICDSFSFMVRTGR